MAITVSPGSGAQSPTGENNLQASQGAGSVPALSGSVQPGTASEQLTTGNGISLTPTPLSTVSLNQQASTTTVPTTAAKPHQINPVLIGVCVLFFIAAIILFWTISRSSKKHNLYN